MNDRSVDGPLISVVITTYNRPTLLSEAVESVRNQTYENLDIVVVDDGSEKPASEVLDADDLPDVRIVRHAENKGANAARNTGIRESEGEFVGFLDDDDRWLPAKLEKQLPLFDDERVGLVYTGAKSVDEAGDVVSVFRPAMRGDVTTDLFTGKYIGSFSKVLVRRSVIEAAGDLDERFPSWQDREWYLRLSQVCAFDYVEEPLVVHHSPDVQISSNFERKRDVTYPLYVEKHRSTAAAYGRYHERRFLATAAQALGASALDNGHYREATRYLARSLRYYPFSPKVVVYLLLSLGGNRTYRGVQKLKHGLVSRLSS